MIKYRLPYKSYDEAEWLLTIDIPSYTGDPITISGVADNSAVLTYEGGVDDIWDNPVINTSLTSEIYNEGQVDVMELQLIEDRQATVTLTRNGLLKFKGFLISDGMQGQMGNYVPYNTRLTATSGLNLLSGIPYSFYGTNSTPRDVFNRILRGIDGLFIQIPIRWTPTVSQIETLGVDAFNDVIWSANGESVFNYNVKTGAYTYLDCFSVIKGLTQALQCRIVQDDGAWWVLGIKESLQDVITYKEFNGGPVTEHTREISKTIGQEYISINNDSVFTVSPALKTVSVIYDHKQRQNILPNGGQDEYSEAEPKYWTGESGLSFNIGPDLTGQGGNSTELNNTSEQEKIYRLIGELPIDANVLYRRLTWGFSFMPISGFPVDENGFIKWFGNEIKTSIKYTVDVGGVVTDYYLNEFGYWGNKNSPANAQVVSVTWDFNFGGNLIIQFDQLKNFFLGDEVIISFVRGGVIETYRIPFEETMDVQSGTDYIASKITNATTPNNWTVQINGVSNDVWNQAYTRKVNDYYKYIYFSVDKLKLNDAAAVSYRGASNLDMFIVDPGDLGISGLPGIGRLSVEFFIRPSQRLYLDEIWMQVDDNNDMYVVTNNATKNANDQEIRLNISSAFSGFKESNFMRSYNTSDVDWKFTDGLNIGSLTELYARSVMRSRYKASLIFNGTISTRGEDWSFLDTYNIGGMEDKKFIPVNPTYNTSKNEVYLIAIESRNDDVSMDIVHKGNRDDVND